MTTLCYSLSETTTVEGLQQILSEHLRSRREPLRRSRRTWYDSFDWRLYRGGLELVHEVQGEHGQLVLYRRDDGQCIARMALDAVPRFASELPPGPLAKHIAPLLGVRALLAQVSVASEEHPLHILDKEEKTVARLILAHNKTRASRREAYRPLPASLSVSEVRGYAKWRRKVDRLLHRQREHLGLTPIPCSLLEPALAAYGRRPADYSSKLDIPLDAEMPAVDAERRILLHLLATLRANVDGVIKDLDSEFLHDFRIAVRRTRSALSQIKGVLPEAEVAPFRAGFAWLGGITGPVRDLDVYLLKFDGYCASLPAGMGEKLLPLKDFLRRKQKSEHAKLARALRSARFRRLLDDWQAYLERGPADLDAAPNARRPVIEVADERIWKLYRRVLKEGRAIDDSSPASQLHELRKTCKKLRYLMEFFQDLYPRKEIRKLIKIFKRLQDNLGDFQDYEVQRHALQQFAEEMLAAGEGQAETLMAMGLLIERLQAGEAETRAAFHTVFEHFAAKENRARFRRLFHPKHALQPVATEETS